MFNKLQLPLWQESEVAAFVENKALRSLEIIHVGQSHYLLLVMKNSLLFEYNGENGSYTPVADFPVVVYKPFYDGNESILLFTADEDSFFSDFRYQIMKFHVSCLVLFIQTPNPLRN